jgi:hypothetical protein
MLLAQHTYHTAAPLLHCHACCVWRTFQVVSACSLSCCMLASLQMQLLLRPRVSAQGAANDVSMNDAMAMAPLQCCMPSTTVNISCDTSEYVLLHCVHTQQVDQAGTMTKLRTIE